MGSQGILSLLACADDVISVTSTINAGDDCMGSQGTIFVLMHMDGWMGV